MPAISNLTAADAKTTPIVHTFVPVQTVPPTWVENGDATVPTVAQSTTTITLKRAMEADGMNRVMLMLKIPVLENTTGGTAMGYVAAPKVAYVMTARLELILPNRSTKDQRRDLRAIFQNLISGNVQIYDVADNLTLPY